jgi:hypothetical protein
MDDILEMAVGLYMGKLTRLLGRIKSANVFFAQIIAQLEDSW